MGWKTPEKAKSGTVSRLTEVWTLVLGGVSGGQTGAITLIANHLPWSDPNYSLTLLLKFPIYRIYPKFLVVPLDNITHYTIIIHE